MKVSRSTARPRRLKRHGGGGTATVAVCVLAILGSLAYAGNQLGWWGGDSRPTSPDKPARAGNQLVAQGAVGDPAVTPATRPAPPAGNHVSEPPKDAAQNSFVPTGAPIPVPEFEKEFEDAIGRGAFRDAEAALAGIGGASDAQRRLDAAMLDGQIRVAARFEQLRSTSGDRAAKVYLSHQLLNFPDHAPARAALEALLAAANAPAPAEVAKPGPAPRRPATTPDPAPDAPARQGQSSDAELVAMKDEAVRVLDKGEIKAALSVLREVATAAEARDQALLAFEAQRLVRQGEAELRLRQAIVDKVTRAAPGDRPIPHLPGESGRIVSANDDGVTFAGPKGSVTLKWRVLPVHSLVAMIQLLELLPPEMTDAAATLYRAGRTAEADGLLASAERAGGAAAKGGIDQVLADARGMAVPGGGFKLVDGKWLSPQDLARHDTARTIAQSTKDLASADPAARRAAFEAMLRLGDAAKSPLQRALALRRTEILDDLRKSPLHAKLADLAERRKELDDARAHALELIEDEVKYPYPYRPPEATAEQYKAYQESQVEIDSRVAKVRGLWNQQLTVSLPKAFAEKAALLVEMTGFLRELGAPPSDQDPEWLLHLPAGAEVTLKTIATSEADRRRIDDSARVMDENATRATKATPGELRQARVTNEYRVMMGRAALAVHDKLTMAAHGHCQDMSDRGFFAHMSPVPGKTSPYDRVRLTGMRPIGVSENIAQASGPDNAHNGWCHSSGHHRNLLASGWKLIGVGNVGHLWCQNFAAGESTGADAGDEARER